MSVGLFFQLLVCAASLALCMVGIEKSGLSSTNFFLAMAGVVTTVTSTYIYCFLSENVASDLSAIGSIFYDCEWYRLPVKQQKLFGVAIQRAQKSFRMTGLGLVECSLRVFTSVSTCFHICHQDIHEHDRGIELTVCVDCLDYARCLVLLYHDARLQVNDASWCNERARMIYSICLAKHNKAE